MGDSNSGNSSNTWLDARCYPKDVKTNFLLGVPTQCCLESVAPGPVTGGLLTLGLWLMTNYTLVIMPQAWERSVYKGRNQQDWFVEHLSARSQLSFPPRQTDPSHSV